MKKSDLGKWIQELGMIQQFMTGEVNILRFVASIENFSFCLGYLNFLVEVVYTLEMSDEMISVLINPSKNCFKELCGRENFLHLLGPHVLNAPNDIFLRLKTGKQVEIMCEKDFCQLKTYCRI